jgi:hypothetical protein
MLSGRGDSRRALVTLGLVLAGVAVAVAVLAALWGIRAFRGEVYPGAVMVSDHTRYQFSPSLFVRRDVSYRTRDDFPSVYQWYSLRYKTGPERQAASACNDLYTSTSWLVFRRDVAITLCESPSGRMMFVNRTFSVVIGP